MKIDETGREIISGKINNFFPARLRLLTNSDDFSLASDDFKTVANSIGKNQTRIRKNHFRPTLSLECSTFNAKGRAISVRRWWKCELISLALIFRGGAIAPATQRSTELALNQ
jgi:hypothetical protein